LKVILFKKILNFFTKNSLDDFIDHANEISQSLSQTSRSARLIHREDENENFMTPEQEAELLRQKYGRHYNSMDGFGEQFDASQQSFLMPSVNDPTLFMIKCKVDRIY
jgi:transcription elongation factor SPT5